MNKFITQMSNEEQSDVYERWLRSNIGRFKLSIAGHLAFLLKRIDEARGDETSKDIEDALSPEFISELIIEEFFAANHPIPFTDRIFEVCACPYCGGKPLFYQSGSLVVLTCQCRPNRPFYVSAAFTHEASPADKVVNEWNDITNEYLSHRKLSSGTVFAMMLSDKFFNSGMEYLPALILTRAF